MEGEMMPSKYGFETEGERSARQAQEAAAQQEAARREAERKAEGNRWWAEQKRLWNEEFQRLTPIVTDIVNDFIASSGLNCPPSQNPYSDPPAWTWGKWFHYDRGRGSHESFLEIEIFLSRQSEVKRAQELSYPYFLEVFFTGGFVIDFFRKNPGTEKRFLDVLKETTGLSIGKVKHTV